MKKKLLILVLGVFLAFGAVGTAGAVDYVKNLLTGDYLTPIVASGNSVWVVGSSVGTTGATLFQIDPTNASVSGSSSYLNVAGFNPTAGTTAYTAPVLFPASDGSGVTLVVQVKQTPNTAVGTNLLYGGTSLYAFSFTPANGGGTTHFNNAAISLAHSGGSQVPQTLDLGYFSTTSGWSTHLLWDTDSVVGGSSIFGTSGVSVSAASNGASIWSVALGNVTGGNRLNSNQWSASTQAAWGVSSFYTPLAITGNSLFAIGEWSYYANSGVSLLMFDKRKLAAGPNKAITLQVNAGTAGATFYPAPAITGNSIFVADARGGLTAYSIQPTNLLPETRNASDFRQLGPTPTTSVSAAPVTDGTFLAVAVNHLGSAVAGVSVFRVSDKQINASTGVSWWYEFTAGTTISATPVISNGNLYVAVNHVNNGATLHRFALSRTAQGRLTADDQNWATDANGNNFGYIEAGGLIISANRLIALSNGPKRIYSIDISSSAFSNPYWYMFKFDGARRGVNTATVVNPPAAVDDDSGTCFISTVK